MKGYLHSIETMGAVDGPGIRTVAFLQGCPAQCIYCHNPDTWEIGKGKIYEPIDIVIMAKRYKTYYGEEGGVTFSGGEPLLQGEFIVECMKQLKEIGINSIIDTSGTYVDRFTEEAIRQAHMVILDIKHTDPNTFYDVTSITQDPLLKLIEIMNTQNKNVWVRQVVVPGLNDTEDNVRELNHFVKRIKHVQKVELLGYHSMGIDKWENLNMEYKLKDVKPMNPTRLKELNDLVKL